MFHDVYEFAQVFKLIGGADQELLKVVFVILHLEQDVCHGPDHVKSTVFLRRRPVKILEWFKHTLDNIFSTLGFRRNTFNMLSTLVRWSFTQFD